MILSTLRDHYVKRWSTRTFKIEYNGYLSNHLLHGLVALQDLGAHDDKITAFAERYVRKLYRVREDDLVQPVALHDATQLRGQRQNYEGLRAMYEAEIDELSVDGAVKKHLPSLVGGLAGSLLHGMIQLGYGYHVGGKVPVAEGLAYLHHSYLSFVDKGDDVHEDQPMSSKKAFTRATAFPLVQRVRCDQTLLDELNRHLHQPFIQNRAQGNLQRRLMSFSADPVVGNPVLFETVSAVVNEFDFEHVNGALALDFAIWLYDTVPQNDFVVLHAVTSAWSLQNLEHLLTPNERVRAWKVWFRVAISAYITHQVPELPPVDICEQSDALLPTLPTWDEIVAHTLALEGDIDEHVYKMVQVARDHVVNSSKHCDDASGSTFLTHTQREYLMKKAALKVISEDFVIGVSTDE